MNEHLCGNESRRPAHPNHRIPTVCNGRTRAVFGRSSLGKLSSHTGVSGLPPWGAWFCFSQFPLLHSRRWTFRRRWRARSWIRTRLLFLTRR